MARATEAERPASGANNSGHHYRGVMTDTGECAPDEDAAPTGVSGLEDLEQDLDTVDKALAALDSGDLEEAEALAAGLDAPSTEPFGDDEPRSPSTS